VNSRVALKPEVFVLLLALLASLPSMAQTQSPPRKRAQEKWLLHGRTLRGESSAGLRYRAYLAKLKMRSLSANGRRNSLSDPNGSWTPLGPAPLASDASGDGQQDYNWVSGRATAVAVDPADPTANTVYVGGAYGGVWKSSNAAASNPGSVLWNPLTDNQATLAVGAIAIQPQLSNPDPTHSVILVGTGEANSSIDSYYGLGILRSANAGTTWSLISTDVSGTRSFAGMAFSKIAFSSSNPNLAVAATAGASEGILEGLANPLTANLGLYTSTDGGLSWSFSTIKDGNIGTQPGSASSVAYNPTAGLFFAALRYHGFYSSSDGISWTRLANQPGSGLNAQACPPNPYSASCPIYRGEIAVVPGRNEMYVWYVDANDNDQGIWQSTNGGATWTQINDSGITNCGDEIGCGTEDGTYNLELTAVPDGGATDLYAGAVNLYKCQITSASPNCSGSGQNTFLNLTHAYGCSSIAQVHPAQHAISFQLVNNNAQDVMYFANDGGLYRALDGYSGLTSGSCSGSNQFDSLNQTLGSLTQLISFSEPPNDFNTILGGAQGNGSPATQSALANSSWLNVNAGDGGYNQINPQNSDEWFVSNPPNQQSGVNIFRCAAGINCHTQDFQNDQVVSSATVGGDTGAYYSFFTLDPQNSGTILVGTCRVWRGASSGSGFAVLSGNFETGGSGTCTGGETNLVRSVAAGGPRDNQNLSNVIYAGTDGYGPLIPTTPSGGHVWVTTNAAGGPSTWVDRTGAINPDAFPISAITLDSSDSTGFTAYVSIMGFHTSHVWRTSNGGATWSDFTSNLPDAPADAIVVDPGANPLTGTVYVATDVGVFSSPTSSANWTEVGPAPNSGDSGYLPNVAVTALQVLSDGNNKLLRASTYGRGMWQFPLLSVPDYFFYVSNTPATVFAGDQAVFNGEIFSEGGYTSSVQLSCANGITSPPPTCSVSPSDPVPSNSGTPFTITAAGAVGTYTFDLHGVGSDADHVAHDSAVTLNVVDFNLTSPSPSNVTVAPGTNSPPIKFQVTAAGPFEETVSLSCSGLPAGAACSFQPSADVEPTSSKPVALTLTISTNANTTAGQFTITLGGSVNNGPTRTQTLTLTVIKDYSVNISNPSQTAYENAIATFQGTLSTLNGYASPVTLSCGTSAPPTCSVAPATVTPTADGTAFTVSVSSNQCGQYNFNVVASGTDPLKTSHSSPVTFISQSLAPPNYTLSISSPALTAPVNTPATFAGTLTATACYNYPVQLSCGSGAPPACAVSPSSVTPTISGASFSVKVSSNKIQTYNFSISAQGSDPKKIQHVAVVSLSVTPVNGYDFSLSNDSGQESVTAGGTATFDLTVTPQDGKFPASVALSYVACPPISTCTVSPAEVSVGASATSVHVTVQTTAPVGASLRQGSRLIYATWLWLPLMCLLPASGRTQRPHTRRRMALVLFSLIFLAACGGGSLQGGGTAAAQPGTPPGVYTMTVSANMSAAPGSPTKTVNLTLTVN